MRTGIPKTGARMRMERSVRVGGEAGSDLEKVRRPRSWRMRMRGSRMEELYSAREIVSDAEQGMPTRWDSGMRRLEA